MTSPFIDPQNLDTILFAGKKSPGFCEIEGLEEVRKFDERAGYGVAGATVMFMGRGICHFTVRLYLWNELEWQRWLSFKPVVDKLPIGKNAKGIEVKHTMINSVGIAAVYVEELFAPTQTEPGLWVVELRLVEARMPFFQMSELDGAEATQNDEFSARTKAQRLYNQAQKDLLSKP